jgi:hypothetical protein
MARWFVVETRVGDWLCRLVELVFWIALVPLGDMY